ncbi:MAG: metallophosphoesterase family protein [Fimbriimonas sp.]
MIKVVTTLGLGLCASVLIGFSAQESTRKPNREGAQNQVRQRAYPHPAKAWSEGTLLLGNATDKSVDLVIHFKSDAEARIQYWLGDSSNFKSTPTFSLKAGVPLQMNISRLVADSGYSYRLSYRRAGESTEAFSPEYRIQTQRKPGSEYVFFVQGDSHPERTPKMHVPSLYEKTLLASAAQKPDLFICLGDDFSVDTLRERTKQTVEGVYTKQVPYLGLVGHSTPIYLVNGNHEQASKANLDGTPNSLGVLVQNARNRNFAQPAPDGFYTGNAEPVEHIGLLRNYFAWTWGDALFVTIDPYWHSATAVDNSAGKGPKEEGGGKRNRNLWDITLGDAQYKWLTRTLLDSKAKYKFVFAHHVNGTGRGAIENATLYEWGGKDPRGGDLFKSKRPGWELPIHQLFVKAGVSIFFQGHDHIYCKQELDGVIYQSCPCPADPTNSLINGEAYKSGEKVPGAGLVRVTVSPTQTKVDYVRAYEPSAEVDGRKHGEIAHTYTVKPKGASK